MATPWADSQEQCFVLLTGANSGVGLGIGQSLINEFLKTWSVKSHLVLIPSTRTPKKSRETIQSLRAHVEKKASSSSDSRRVHLLSMELDLCKLPTIYAAADTLVNGTLRDPTGHWEGEVAVPRLDAVLLNAGIGGWSGLDWWAFAKQFVSQGIIQSTTFPIYKLARKGAVLPPQDVLDGRAQPALGEVFCANIFGHYLLVHELLPLTMRTDRSQPPARMVWTSSIDAERRHLNPDDLQALQSDAPYESSKRITDVMCLSSELPNLHRLSGAYLSLPGREEAVRPRLYLSHPGVVVTSIFPLHVVLFYGYWAAMYVSRWVGSPWHPIDPCLGACATVWLALASEEELDSKNAQRIKWGSSTDRRGKTTPKQTEVWGWGWEGRVEDQQALRDDLAAGTLRELKGRKWDAVEVTDESRATFDEDAIRVWTSLEQLRSTWEGILGRGV